MITTTQTQPALSAKLSDVGETSLLTLYCRAAESQTPDPILIDERAVEITERLNPLLANSGSRLLCSLAGGKVNPRLRVHIALRAKKYDEYARGFLARNPEGLVVNIGCGMDTRFFRIDNGKLILFDLDLPEIISLKREVLAESGRYHMIGCSAFDYEWMEQVKSYGERPALFLAEGVFMYLDGGLVKALVLELQSRFPGSEMVCEVVNKKWLSKPLKSIVNLKMQREMGLGKDTEYRFGISDSREMETWHAGIQFLDEWSYFDTGHPKLGWMKIFKGNKLMNTVQWTAHYKLN